MDIQDAELAPRTITKHLQSWKNGDEGALALLATEVYQELRRLAGAVLGSRSGHNTVQPTVLVHELYFRLPGVQHIEWQSRAQFLNVAARMMRNILVDHARRRHSAKRGGGELPVLIDVPSDEHVRHLDVLLVNAALDKFTVDYPRQARIVELRFFGGLTADETLEVLNATGVECSLRTVERDWTFARAWLQAALKS